MQGYADLVHPLTKLVWGKNKGKVHLDVYDTRKQYAVLQEKIVITCEEITNWYKIRFFHGGSNSHDNVKLSAWYASITDLGSWTPFSVPAVRGFALTTYHSQLVLVGGWTDGKKVLNTLWASADGTNWQETLPPMPTSRYGAAVVNTGSSGGPECLVVAGGKKEDDEIIATVEVLTEGQWSTVASLPQPRSWQNCFYHNGGVYLVWRDHPSYTEDDETSVYIDMSAYIPEMFCCQLHSLLASDKQSSPWQTVPTPASSYTDNLVSFQGRLVSFGREICVYCPLQQCWVCVGEMSNREVIEWVTATPAGQLIIFTHSDGCTMTASEATIRVSPYDADSEFSEEALHLLELAQFPMETSLKNVADQIAAATGAAVQTVAWLGWRDAVNAWIRGYRYSAGSETLKRPPTWRELCAVMRELGLEELSQQIEDYLSCPRSLKEQCTSVIMCALLQQSGSLEPDQLHVRLPDYVPTTVKHSLTHTLKAHTLRLNS